MAVCSLGGLLCMTVITAQGKNGRNAKTESKTEKLSPKQLHSSIVDVLYTMKTTAIFCTS